MPTKLPGRPKKTTYKYMQVLNQQIYRKLKMLGKQRGINVQELTRAVIIPEWLEIRKRRRAKK